METDGAVEKQKPVFPQLLAKPCWVSHSSHRLGGLSIKTTKRTFICYKKRTFLFATDSLKF